MIITEPGVYDIPDDVYHADPVPGGSLSSTGARRLLPPSCPAIFRYELDHPRETAAFDLGKAAHLLVLGAGAELVIIAEADWRKKAAQEARDAARKAGKIPLLATEHERVQEMAAAIRAHPLADALFDPRGGKAEQSLFWQDADTGVWCRARPDWLRLGNAVPYRRLLIVDYKTADKADPASFGRSAASYGYHQQDAWYTDAVRALGLSLDPAFLFVVQQKTPPYLVTICELDETARRAGRELNRRAVERYRDCSDINVWPGHSDEVETVSLPPWATRIEEYA